MNAGGRSKRGFEGVAGVPLSEKVCRAPYGSPAGSQLRRRANVQKTCNANLKPSSCTNLELSVGQGAPRSPRPEFRATVATYRGKCAELAAFRRR